MVIALALAGLAGLGFYYINQQVANPTNTKFYQQSNDQVADKKVVGQTRREADNSLSYQEAKTKYEGQRFQFDNCDATPNYFTVKNGTKIMLDSRSADGNDVILDGVHHVLKAYQFEIVTLSSKNLPHTVKIDCFTPFSKSYNVASVLVQP